MNWHSEVEELEQRKKRARQMGGHEQISKQHGKGRLTIRERLDQLLDQDSFQEIGTLAGGAMAEFRREIEAAPDPEAKRMEIEKRLADIASPARTANHFTLMGVEEVIDPRATRPLLCEFVEQAQGVTETQLGPKYRGMRP